MYFESYDFSRIFLNLFKYIFNFEKNKKIKKYFIYRELTWWSVTSWLVVKHLLWIYANPLYTHFLYACQIDYHFDMWDYLCLFLITSDVAQWDSSDRAIQSRSSNFTYSRGYVGASDYAMIYFEEDLISPAHLRSYNDRD